MTNRTLAVSRSAARKQSRGLMRYPMDLWSVAWVQLTLLVSLLPFVVDIPMGWQLALAVPVFFFRTTCPYLQHNQGHLGVFWRPLFNHIYDIQLALMTGYVTSLWELQHSRGHHRHYLTPQHDP